MAYMVNCVKLGRELPGLERQPYPGEMGQRIYENISQQAWEMWMQHSVILINHYGLSLGDPKAREFSGRADGRVLLWRRRGHARRLVS